jgi:hypothetical protein
LSGNQTTSSEPSKDSLEAVRDLLTILLLRDGVDYELVSEASGIGLKTLYQRFPKKKVSKKG